MSLESVSVFERFVPLFLSVLVSLCVVLVLHLLEHSSITHPTPPPLNCPLGMFRLSGMDTCQSWLDCDRINAEVKVYQELQFSMERYSHLAKWGRHLLTYSAPTLGTSPTQEKETLTLLQELSGTKFVAQLVGYCLATGVILTEYHRHVTATHVNEVLTRAGRYSLVDRLSLCVNFAELLSLLHSQSPPLVLCPSSSETILSQLILTDDYHLLLWDTSTLVALDKTGNTTELCAGLPGEEDFIIDMSGYNKAVDIWRAPTICSVFLGQVEGSKSVKNLLQPMHRKCRNRDPRLRPSARDLLKYYKEVLKDIWYQPSREL